MHLQQPTNSFPYCASFGNGLALYQGEHARALSLRQVPAAGKSKGKNNAISEKFFISASLRSSCAGLGRGHSGLGAAGAAVRIGFPEHTFFGCAAALPDGRSAPKPAEGGVLGPRQSLRQQEVGEEANRPDQRPADGVGRCECPERARHQGRGCAGASRNPEGADLGRCGEPDREFGQPAGAECQPHCAAGLRSCRPVEQYGQWSGPVPADHGYGDQVPCREPGTHSRRARPAGSAGGQP